MKQFDVIIVGGGIYGMTAVVALQARGYQTAVLDPGPLPHPLAATTDISKAIRMGYGPDEEYTAMVEAAMPGWQRWNEEFGQLYHEIGVTMLTREPMTAGGFEYESYRVLQKRGHLPERLNVDEIGRRFPAWKPGAFVDGFYHAVGGFAESGKLVEALIGKARQLGATILPGQTVQDVVMAGGRVTAVSTQQGNTFYTDQVVVAAGTWTHILLPELAPVMYSTGHPVFHLKTHQPHLFTPPNFTVFTADVARTGWYGFPQHPQAGIVKIANHGVGRQLHPVHDPRVVTAEDEKQFRIFLADTFPALVDAPITYTRRCLYCDTPDEHFWIDRHPHKPGLTVAAGGSGHGFKFAPILGELIADAMEGKNNPWLHKFKWRRLTADTTGEEAARFRG